MIEYLTKAEIDLAAIAHNVRELRRATAPCAGLLAVVKANGYGHGSVETAEIALKNGADSLGVARIEEGRKLRNAGIVSPVLVFGYPPESQFDSLIEFGLTATIFSTQTAKNLAKFAVSKGQTIKAHIKVDTGMGRVGFLTDIPEPCCDHPEFTSLVSEISAITQLKGLEIEGIYTHFACSDTADKTYTRQQFSRFSNLLDRLSKNGIDIPIKHAANSGALLQHSDTHLDLVRPGISIYGLYPSDDIHHGTVTLHPAMSLKSQIIHIKRVPPGFTVSYGRTHTTGKETRIASIPVGYADGYNRLLSNTGHMLVHGIKAPVVGRVCMDLTMIDVGHIPDVSVGDEVVVFGTQNNALLPVDNIADMLHTINYEVVTGISERVPRSYKFDGVLSVER